PVGIVAGLVGGGCYNRFSTTRLPDYLAFFGGRRLVPIVAGIAAVCGSPVSRAIAALASGPPIPTPSTSSSPRATTS
ncbi:PTS transporter subunit EIIC, partial [Escherichia coli]|uniref:PTS transporter subunit EIIC n=1 Tax=Escherichia coli TaxID=562 RepID=UPI001931EF15